MDRVIQSDNKALSGEPRSSLARWANNSDEWVRRLVRQVLSSEVELSESQQEQIYQLLLEEKGIVDRTLPAEPPLINSKQPSARPEPFQLVRVSNVKAVNALAEGEEVAFSPGLTLLYGENGMGKTGYARILKRLAGSRSAEDIIADVNLEDDPPPPSAQIHYSLGELQSSYMWNGEQAQPPFTGMSIFDNSSARLHVDEDLRYTYRPASLALFDRVNLEVQNIRDLIEKERRSLDFDKSALLSRFDSQSPVYPYLESLSPATNLLQLQEYLDLPDEPAEREKNLENTIATLRADLVGQQISQKSMYQSALTEALDYISIVGDFQVTEYSAALNKLSELHEDQSALRESLFTAANIPEPEERWEDFIRAGQEYKRHLESHGVHDDTICLYCRQQLGSDARNLLVKYSEYLESQIASEIEAQNSTIRTLRKSVEESSLKSVQALCELQDIDANEGLPAPAEQTETLQKLLNLDMRLRKQFTDNVMVDENILTSIDGIGATLQPLLSDVMNALKELRSQNADRDEALKKEEKQLIDLRARRELNRSWEEITRIVAAANRHQKLTTERTAIRNILRSVTLLSNKASEQLINSSFQQTFQIECAELRAPDLELEFSGREGRTQRKKRLPGGLNPSKVFSEGEQKVLAIADFLAEVRMSDNSVPVIFDDPVSSLDHRRIGEVARRIADLASEHQVVVLTHDIWLVTHLLDKFEKSDRCVYYQVTDDRGSGTITPGTGPRWDSISNFRAKINVSIDEAKRTVGEERQSHIRDAYNSIRSWCELFVEQEVLAKVTERYQPNVRMMSLSMINVQKLEHTRQVVTSVFEDACRYIEAHSQPLQTLSVAPKLSDLEGDWAKLQKCRQEYNKG